MISLDEIMLMSFGRSIGARKRRVNKAKQAMKQNYDKNKTAKELDWAKKSIGKLVVDEYRDKKDKARWSNFANAPSKTLKKEQSKQLNEASYWLDRVDTKRKWFLEEEREQIRIINAMNK